ncbi:hypothetical protein ABH922_004822 [Rhodococcus sp. 27YEA15]|uniref:TPR repeat region-containing protein n=1 Tax=Rhodococcus sp. 27YEA15 TaxID=3156259 RepID=UPI003C79AA13
MSVTRTQLQSWDPGILNGVADAWTKVGESAAELFERYHRSVIRVGDEYWEGLTAEAAEQRAMADKRTVAEVVEALGAAVEILRQGYFDIDAPLKRARGAISDAEDAGFAVSDSLLITDTRPGTDAARAAVMMDFAERLSEAAGSTVEADNSVRRKLSASRAGLRAMFVSAATLGGDQGRSDAKAFADHPNDVSAEQARRLAEGGHLTAEQLHAIERGETAAIPASQMEYLNQVGRALDGKTPQEIEDLLSKLPADARAGVANSLQILSNEHVTASVRGDSEVPTTGGLDLLPKEIRESLTRDDLVTSEFKITQAGGFRSVDLNGVADNQAIASIVAMGDEMYKGGTALDKSLLDVGRQYLDAQVAHEQSPNRTFEAFMVDGRGTQDMAITEQIFSAVGGDKIAVDAAVNDPVHGSDFVKDILAHDWTDDGQAVSSLFAFGEHDGTVEDPDNPVDVATATRTGNIMEALGRSVSSDEAWKYLSNIPGTDGQSVGQVNPELLQTVSRSMSPYVSDLAGADPADRPGFDIGNWADPDRTRHYAGSANVFALMNTDEAAGTHFTQAAYQAMLEKQGEYGADPMNPESEPKLRTAGFIAGLVDKGMMISTQDQYDDTAQQAAESYRRRAAGFDALLGSFGLGQIDGGDLSNAILGGGGLSMKDAVIGGPPLGAETARLTGFDDIGNAYSTLLAIRELPLDFKNSYEWAFNPNGELKTWEEVQDLRLSDEKMGAFKVMLSRVGRPDDGHGSAMDSAYDKVVQ